MLNNETLNNLRTLKLIGMADALEQQLTQPATHEDLSFDERIALLVDREVTSRKNTSNAHHRKISITSTQGT